MQNIIEKFTLFTQIPKYELCAYIILLGSLFTITFKNVLYNTRKKVHTILLSIINVMLLSIVTICIMLLFNQNNTIQEKQETKMVINYNEESVKSKEYIEDKVSFTDNTDYYTTMNGFVTCTIYTTALEDITSKDLLCDENFCNSVEVIKDENVAGKYYVIYSQFVQEGTYAVTLRDTQCIFNIHVVSEVSDKLTLTCTPSNTCVSAGDTLTLLLEYSGVDVTTGVSTLQYDDNYITLRNCVGKIQSVVQNKTVVCITLADIGVLDDSKNIGIEIAQGTMLDSIGAPVNGVELVLEYIS